ncbi:phosphoglucosamine mutase [Liberiplasma polymorphum]|uniref:phosphoglucosamine mutase n=1 Tax=Liberiplasma polymorphum TaxID=3374570 RepID=UPI003772D2C6
MGKYFGTDGIRGVAGDFLNAHLAFNVGLSLKYVLKTNTVVIGKDTRESSDMLAYSLAAGALSAGVDVIMAGVVSTPMIAYYSKVNAMCGVMITASHNPFKDNGIKIFNKGYKMLEKDEDKIEAFLENPITKTPTSFGTLNESNDILETYKELYKTLLNEKVNISVGYDSANGANYQMAKMLLEPLCDESYQINALPDGKNINVECGSTYLDAIKALVKDKKLDIGFSFDGDGDRCLVIDHNLKIYDGDLIIYAIAKHLKSIDALNKNTVVLTKMSNPGIIKAFKDLGIKTVLTDVGDKYVTHEILKNNYTIGGENSGHIILNHLLHTGDGLLVAVTLLNILQTLKTSLKCHTKEVQLYPQKMVNIKHISKSTLEEESVKSIIKEAKKHLGEDSLLLVRASGTEPLIRVTISHQDEATLDHVMASIVDVIKQSGRDKI